MTTKELIGWILFTVGFLVAAATAMPKPPMWNIFVPALVLSMVGALIARFASQGHNEDHKELQGDTDAKSLLDKMVKAIEAIDGKADEQTVQAAIEDIQFSLIAPFVELRRKYLQEFGPVTFAHFFGAFARGERNVNRAWSALIDGHREELGNSLVQARASMAEAGRILREEA